MALSQGIMAVSVPAAALLSASSSYSAARVQTASSSLPALGSRRGLAVRASSAEQSANFGPSSQKLWTPKITTNAVAAKQEAAASTGAKGPGHELLLYEALREGLEEEMERDPHVCVMGEDVGHYGGSYKVTKGFAEKFGDWRLLDTPIAENSFTGMAVGAAMTGLRPVIEGMNMGFLLLAYNQISNNCGMLHYTSGGQFTIPCVIRGPGGVGRQLGAEHSQRLESYFQSVPGLQMVACSTPYNAKGLMKAAIRSNNPVILFEHVLLYNLKETIPDEDYVCCLEEAEMVRPGKDITILTYSRMRHYVLQAAKTLVNKGYDPEIIDIRSLKPFDMFTIGNSVKKTHKVLIVEECMRTGGIGASLRAAIMENFFDYLDAPIGCLSSQDVPTPYSGPLEELTVVQPHQIITAVENLLAK
ncbi:pyruvate dehydrogenase E1 component subunit beta [Marchantia polymorpha subsp. ruderalis]|uniref:pyruvate dehydrogenase (acetyl-transferring) n=2 Tax=Marchantia polymorpha TaxID=3197 RepID=A0A176WAH0_MARPO|nr:hypothetical protein AXG93_1112s1030 [Marchantia polymorpha subsp. ruderalis]PTQ38352.1 hypothetical protein MARPO_0052s0126 [Marchantia polymorpha]BBN13095.1 hypothetical protein Mp_6g00740 [Marchantia polymorpha subsp. ruderalis]|eukprot:PTQ38352.1 hypothetical protein MARPO_0052s0126 [Marchantia polymorpha]